VIELKQLGHDLGVRYVVEGSVRKALNKVRIAAHLIQIDTKATRRLLQWAGIPSASTAATWRCEWPHSVTRKFTGTAVVARLGRLRGCPKPTWLSRIGNAQATWPYDDCRGHINASASLSTDRPCPFGVRLGSDRPSASCPLSPGKRTPLRAQVTLLRACQSTHRRVLTKLLPPFTRHSTLAPDASMIGAKPLSSACRNATV
jgi:hypothetical protein